jgi:hypothetical protein
MIQAHPSEVLLDFLVGKWRWLSFPYSLGVQNTTYLRGNIVVFKLCVFDIP